MTADYLAAHLKGVHERYDAACREYDSANAAMKEEIAAVRKAVRDRSVTGTASTLMAVLDGIVAADKARKMNV